jgi:hypothetical protein
MALSHSECNTLALILGTSTKFLPIHPNSLTNQPPPANGRILYGPNYTYDVVAAMDTGPAPFTKYTVRALLVRYTRLDPVRSKVMSVGILRVNEAFRPDVD